jgi:hypothetical protein
MTENTWQHVKAFLNPYNRMEDYLYNLAQYTFPAGCRCDNMGYFIKFIGFVATMAWYD